MYFGQYLIFDHDVTAVVSADGDLALKKWKLILLFRVPDDDQFQSLCLNFIFLDLSKLNRHVRQPKTVEIIVLKQLRSLDALKHSEPFGKIFNVVFIIL